MKRFGPFARLVRVKPDARSDVIRNPSRKVDREARRREGVFRAHALARPHAFAVLVGVSDAGKPDHEKAHDAPSEGALDNRIRSLGEVVRIEVAVGVG